MSALYLREKIITQVVMKHLITFFLEYQLFPKLPDGFCVLFLDDL